MVSVSTMLAGLSAIAATAAAASLPTFDIPAFDYASLTAGDVPSRVLEALQSDGIIALKNIPNYANLRERYLREAAQCAAMQSAASDFVSRKLFADGTNRFTISMNAGRELRGSAVATDSACPGYRALYEEFSETVERAVNTFGSALDATAFTASDGQKRISSRQLVGDAVRLDHFHAYEAAASSSSSVNGRALKEESALSLPLHEDHGLFIAMSAPKFFEVGGSGNSRELVERELAADASGLIIQTASGQRVRPVLQADEVVIMMGTGASRWLQTSHAMPAVMHGMQMPASMVASAEAGRRSLRAWFGKMTLLPAYQRMLLNNGIAFEEHTNATTRYLLTKDESELKTVGCASGRNLEASAVKDCTVKRCTLKPGFESPEDGGCAGVCNREEHSEDDEPLCKERCTCTEVASDAARCWMLCVLPAQGCGFAEQTCSGQELKCPTSTTTKPPTTSPSPSTKTPTSDTPGPSTPGSTTGSPQTPSSPSPSEPGSDSPSGSSSTSASGSTSNADDVSSPTSPVPGTPSPSSANTVFVASTMAATVLAASALLL